jgi:hypothetical protein
VIEGRHEQVHKDTILRIGDFVYFRMRVFGNAPCNHVMMASPNFLHFSARFCYYRDSDV